MDDKVELAPPVGERAQRPAKKAETKGWAPPAMETGHTDVGMGAKVKEIKEINSEELDNEGAYPRQVPSTLGRRKKAQRPRGGHQRP